MSRQQIPWERAVLDDRLARMAWSRLTEPESTTAAAFVLAHGGHGPALEALMTRRSELADRLAPRIETLDVGADRYLAELVGARVVIPDDDEWPEGLDELDLLPHCLWVRGPIHLADACRRSVAIVGSRNATAYGRGVAHDMAATLADRGFAVISGAAFGIDADAHRGALAVDGATVAVLATGIDRAYPVAHRGLIDEIARTGAVVSEVAPGSAAIGRRFLQRNRIIALMASGVVVVEAGIRSGSISTANRAVNQHRPVGFVPGPVGSPVSAGCHEELRRGTGILVTDADEVAELVGRIGVDLAEPKRGLARPEDDLAPQEHQVFEAMPVRSPCEPQAVARATTLGEPAVLASFGRLELAGLVRRNGDQWRKLPPGQRPGAAP